MKNKSKMKITLFSGVSINYLIIISALIWSTSLNSLKIKILYRKCFRMNLNSNARIHEFVPGKGEEQRAELSLHPINERAWVALQFVTPKLLAAFHFRALTQTPHGGGCPQRKLAPWGPCCWNPLWNGCSGGNTGLTQWNLHRLPACEFWQYQLHREHRNPNRNDSFLHKPCERRWEEEL